MPVNKTSTLSTDSLSENKFIKVTPKPETIMLLKHFARTFSPDNKLKSKVCLN